MGLLQCPQTVLCTCLLSMYDMPGFVFCAGEGDMIPIFKGYRDPQLAVLEYSKLLSSLNISDGQRR